MKYLLPFFLLAAYCACAQNAILRNRWTTNTDSATIHGDTVDQLKADKLATGVADPHRLGTGGPYDANHFLNGLGQFVVSPGLVPQVWTNNGGFDFLSGANNATNSVDSLITSSGNLRLGTNSLDPQFAGIDTILAWSDLTGPNAGVSSLNLSSGESNSVKAFARLVTDYNGGLVELDMDWDPDSSNNPQMHHALTPQIDPTHGAFINFFQSNSVSTILGPFPTFGFSYGWDSVGNFVDLGSRIHTVWTTNGVFGTPVAEMSVDGLMTANGFADSSGPADSVSVAVSGPSGRLVYTQIVQNVFINYITNNTAYITNLFTTYVTNNLSYITNLYSTYVTNNQFYSTNIYVTNLFASFITNNTIYTTNLFVNNLRVNNMYVTNNFYLTISSWPGATNNYDLSKARQQFTMTTACAVTNFLNVPGTGTELGSVLTLTNSTGGDLIVYFTPGGITTDDGARSYTVTNKTQRAFSIRVADTGTNVIARTFY